MWKCYVEVLCGSRIDIYTSAFFRLGKFANENVDVLLLGRIKTPKYHDKSFLFPEGDFLPSILLKCLSKFLSPLVRLTNKENVTTIKHLLKPQSKLNPKYCLKNLVHCTVT